MKLGEKICKLRYEHQITLEQLGEIVGVNTSVICNYQSGKSKKPDVFKVHKLAAAFNMTLDEFMSDVDEPE